MNSINILIVSDDEQASTNIKKSLKKEGYAKVNVIENTRMFRQKVQTYKPNLLMIDTSLSTEDDGIELASYVNEKYALPFILLSSKVDHRTLDKAKLVQPYGYIVKPCNPEGLNASIQIALHKHAQEHQRKIAIDTLESRSLELKKRIYHKKAVVGDELMFGDGYTLSGASCSILHQGKKIKLTKRENAFIQLLVNQLGSTVSFKEAIDYLWEKDVSENSVRTLAWRLRNKLPTEIIQNDSGFGYYINS